MNELKDHFEKTLKYNVETTLEDSGGFPTHMRAVKKTRVTVNKEVGEEYDKVRKTLNFETILMPIGEKTHYSISLNALKTENNLSNMIYGYIKLACETYIYLFMK
jgi:hypothetical protein